jgi:hypothetical protein
MHLRGQKRAHGRPENNVMKRGAMRIVGSTSHPNLRKARPIVRAVIRRSGLVVLAALLGGIARAASGEDATKLFDAGRVAFQGGDYDAALKHYEAAAAAGLEGSVVDFNIGVAAYRAGKLNRAEQAFTQAARSASMSSLAHYNLGLVAQSRGDHDSARKWFQHVAEIADDERLKNLALRQLGHTEGSVRRNWNGYASAGVGHDDNVALAPDSDVLEVSGKDDAFAEAQAGLSAVLNSHWRVEAGLDQIDYLDLDEFDLLSTHAAAHYRFAEEEWTHEARLQVTYSRVGGHSFETRRAISFQSSRALTSEWLFRGRYRFSHLDGLGSYDGLDGTRHEVQARFVYDVAPLRLSVSYEYELNNQRSDSLASDRQEVQFFAERELTQQWTIETDAAVQRSQYEAGGADTLMEGGLSVARTLTAQWRVLARLAHSRNESDDSTLDYDVNQISLGAEVRF